MTQNPFDALGGGGEGGFDMNALLQQAQQMQEQLQQAQERLNEATVEGTAGGGAVRVTVNGVGELVAVDLTAAGAGGAADADLADLGDLVVAAYRDAKTKADAMAAEALGPMGGGLDQLGGQPGGEPGAQPGPLGF